MRFSHRRSVRSRSAGYPADLEAFLSFLSATEDYQIEINASHPPPTPEQLQHMSWKEYEEQEMLRTEVGKERALHWELFRMVRTSFLFDDSGMRSELLR